ncbi:MAG: beta-ketoacyl synthase N-terminal-like domain-containing protein, partial [Pyrinomonadaceae bacterium]
MFNNLRQPRRVVITGFGCVTPIGIGRKKFWESLKNGVSGVKKIESFDASEFAVQIAAEIQDFDWEAELSVKDRRNVARTVPLALRAGREALEDAGMQTNDLSLAERQNFGVILGTGGGG